MTREERESTERYIKEHATNYFKRDESGKGYVCPICGSGTHDKGTGITENPKDKGHFTCWAGCFRNADIFEIIGKQFNLTDFNEIFKKACEIFKVSPDDGNSYDWTSPKSKEVAPPEVWDFTEFYKKAAANLSQTNYYRGISLETLKRFNVGYVPNWKHPKSPPNVQESPRLIIPVSKEGYLARDTRENLTYKQKEYAKQRAGKSALFNVKAMNEATEPIYVLEGELDALSVIDVGANAIALGSITNANRFLSLVEKSHSGHSFIIVMDNDGAGQRASKSLCEELEKRQIFFYRHSLPENYKDANEYLMSNRERFKQWVKTGITACKEKANLDEDEARREFESEIVTNRLNNFLAIMKESREGKAIPTGFSKLDEILDGGLYPGLYSVGAISSLGKTTLCLQMADNIARSGYGVLIFSLEMSANELIAKSLSRLTLIKDMAETGTKKNAKTTREILRGNYNEAEEALITKAINDYAEFGSCINITEGIGDVNIFEVKAKIERYKNYHGGKPPVVIIDYLQIIEAYSDKKTDKQNVDKNITELKRMSRDYQIPIIGISSFNRENYSAPVSMASFKESGAIEYSSDVLIGLQYKGFDYINGEQEKIRTQRLNDLREQIDNTVKNGGAVEVQLKVLKHRNGRRGEFVLEFFPQYNYFRAKEK